MCIGGRQCELIKMSIIFVHHANRMHTSQKDKHVINVKTITMKQEGDQKWAER